jgi:hypothetical protein
VAVLIAGLSVSENLALDLEGNANTGKASGLTARNTSDHDVWVQVVLTDGRAVERVFGPGTVSLTFPANVVSVVQNAEGDMELVGVRSIGSRDPA